MVELQPSKLAVRVQFPFPATEGSAAASKCLAHSSWQIDMLVNRALSTRLRPNCALAVQVLGHTVPPAEYPSVQAPWGNFATDVGAEHLMPTAGQAALGPKVPCTVRAGSALLSAFSEARCFRTDRRCNL